MPVRWGSAREMLGGEFVITSGSPWILSEFKVLRFPNDRKFVGKTESDQRPKPHEIR